MARTRNKAGEQWTAQLTVLRELVNHRLGQTAPAAAFVPATDVSNHEDTKGTKIVVRFITSCSSCRPAGSDRGQRRSRKRK